MTPLTHRHLILIFALLCQVLSTVHAPMARAAAGGSAPVGFAHCAGHAHETASDSTNRPGVAGTGHPHPSGYAGSCGCGLCHCPCAQAPALMSALTVVSDIAHVLVGLPYRTPEAPQLATRFFRPPI